MLHNTRRWVAGAHWGDAVEQTAMVTEVTARSTVDRRMGTVPAWFGGASLHSQKGVGDGGEIEGESDRD